MNSDQGSQFTSPQYIELFLDAGVEISMDGRGRALDNIFIERLWRSLKWEDIYLKDYATPREVRIGVANWLEFYNHERPHQSLNYKTPAQIYFKKEEVLPIHSENDEGLMLIEPVYRGYLDAELDIHPTCGN